VTEVLIVVTYCEETLLDSMGPEWQIQLFHIPVVPALKWSIRLLYRLNIHSLPPRAGPLTYLY